MERNLGSLLIALGAIAVLIGVLVSTGALSWFGRLPGDLRFESERNRVFIPITSMLLVSMVVSGVLILIDLLRR